MVIEFTEYGVEIPGFLGLSWALLATVSCPVIYDVNSNRRNIEIKILARTNDLVVIEIIERMTDDYEYRTTYKVGDYVNRVWPQ